MPSKPTCLFVGRFQPFHNGHLLVVQGMVKVCGKVVIALGISKEEGKSENPFSADERKDMIQRALQAKNIIPNYDVNFVEVPDQASDADWTKAVLEAAGPVDQAWTGNADTKKCFEAAGVKVKDIKEVPGISATEVRRRMTAGEDWKALVPLEVAATISALDGVARVKGK